MRKVLITAILASSIAYISSGQDAEVPAVVSNAFAQKVPDAKVKEWEYDDDHKIWEVEYRKDRKTFTAAFDEKGTWIETEMDISYAKLTEAVKNVLKSDFSEYRIDEVEIVQNPDGMFYEIEAFMKKEGEKYELEVLITPAGKVVKKEMEGEEEEEKDKENM